MPFLSLLISLFLFFPQFSHAENLPVGGKLRCLFASNDQFGFLLRQPEPGTFQIDAISNGTVEGEATRRMAEQKDYGTPLILFLNSYTRSENYGTYLEFLIEQNFDYSSGAYPASVMFTEAFYESSEEGEKEFLSPVYKRSLRCLPE
mgnify:CR=1 FL=1